MTVGQKPSHKEEPILKTLFRDFLKNTEETQRMLSGEIKMKRKLIHQQLELTVWEFEWGNILRGYQKVYNDSAIIFK